MPVRLISYFNFSSESLQAFWHVSCLCSMFNLKSNIAQTTLNKRGKIQQWKETDKCLYVDPTSVYVFISERNTIRNTNGIVGMG